MADERCCEKHFRGPFANRRIIIKFFWDLHLVMGGDNNLVLYSSNGMIWAYGTTCGSRPAYSVIEDDGNFVIYDKRRNIQWASEFSGGNCGSGSKKY